MKNERMPLGTSQEAINNGRTGYYERDIGTRYGKINYTVFLSSGHISTGVYNVLPLSFRQL